MIPPNTWRGGLDLSGRSIAKQKLHKIQVHLRGPAAAAAAAAAAECFNTAVFKQLTSKMSVFITGESGEVWSASPRAPELQLDSLDCVTDLRGSGTEHMAGF